MVPDAASAFAAFRVKQLDILGGAGGYSIPTQDARRIKAAQSLEEMYAVMATAPPLPEGYDLSQALNANRRATGERLPFPEPDDGGEQLVPHLQVREEVRPELLLDGPVRVPGRAKLTDRGRGRHPIQGIAASGKGRQRLVAVQSVTTPGPSRPERHDPKPALESIAQTSSAGGSVVTERTR